MIEKLSNIVEGWRLWLKSDKATNDMARQRQAICDPCQHRIKSLNVCGECGCFLSAKARVQDEQCPHDYW